MEVSKIYQSLAQSIVNSISDNWITAKIEIEFIGSVGLSLNYSTEKKESKSEWIEDDDTVTDNIIKLHKITTENKKNKWNRAIFSLKPDGDFNMEFIWDQELQDEVESYLW